MSVATKPKPTLGYLPDDRPPVGAMISLGFQQVLTMFPATVLVAILTKFDIGVTLAAAGLGTIIALLVSGRRIPPLLRLQFQLHHGHHHRNVALCRRLLQQSGNDLLSRRSPPSPGGHYDDGGRRDCGGPAHHARR